MLSPHHREACEADRVANGVCRRRLMNAALAAAAAWLTYVNPFTLHVRTDAAWYWLAAIVAISAFAGGFALWSITTGDRRAWVRAFHAAARRSVGSAPAES